MKEWAVERIAPADCRSPIQGGRHVAGLSRLSLIFRVRLDENEVQGQVATNTRNIHGLAISTENLR
jgi:hypothetical protein